MPSQFDDSYHWRFSKPVFDTDADRRRIEKVRECDEVLELKAAPLPTREVEDEYMDFLKADFKSDPWFTHRFRKFMAGPKRIPWRNHRELKRQFQYTFLAHWIVGGVVFWPIACVFGNRMKRYQGGVPVVPYQRFVHDFPNLEPTRLSRATFRNWSVASCVLAGFIFARMTVDPQQKLNVWYNRPDLKPYAAMVKDNEGVPEDVTHKTMLENAYISKRAASQKGASKSSAWYRYLFAADADWTIKGNPYAHHHKHDVYSSGNGYYSTYTNDFRDHMQK